MIELSLSAIAVAALGAFLALSRQVTKNETQLDIMRNEQVIIREHIVTASQKLTEVATSQDWVREAVKEIVKDIKHIRKTNGD